MTQVTMTVRDPSGNLYTSAKVLVSFTANPAATPGTAIVAGGTSPFPTQVEGITNSFGFISLQLTDLAAITPAGSSWTFTVFSNTTPAVGFSFASTAITGASVDISAAMQAAAAVLPSLFGNITVNNATITGSATITTLTAGSVNNVLQVGNGAGQYASIFACLAALPTAVYAACSDGIGQCYVSGGGICKTPPGWIDPPWTQNLVFQNNKSLHLMAPFYANQGTHQATMAGGVHGVTVTCEPGDHSQRTSGCTFDYSGSSDQWAIGDGTAGIDDIHFSGLQLHSIAGGDAAQPLHLQRPSYSTFSDLDLVCSNSATNTGNGLLLEMTAADSHNNFQGITPNFCNNPVKFNNASFNIWNGGIPTNPKGTGGAVFDIEGNSIKNIFNNPVLAAGGGTFSSFFNFGGTSSGNEVFADNGNGLPTKTVVFGASTGNNVYHCIGAGCTVTDNSASTSGNQLFQGGLRGVLNQQAASGALTGNSSDQTLFTYTLPANVLLPGKCLKVSVAFLHSTGSASVSYKTFLASTAITTFAYAPNDNTDNDFYELKVCNNTGVQNAQSWMETGQINLLTSGTVPLSARTGTSSIDFTSNQVIKVTFNVANTDQVTPKFWLVEALP